MNYSRINSRGSVPYANDCDLGVRRRGDPAAGARPAIGRSAHGPERRQNISADQSGSRMTFAAFSPSFALINDRRSAESAISDSSLSLSLSLSRCAVRPRPSLDSSATDLHSNRKWRCNAFVSSPFSFHSDLSLSLSPL